jgi:hypothetical protein
MPETYRFHGSKGLMEVTGSEIRFSPQSGEDNWPSYYTGSYPRAMREAYLQQWHREHDPKPGQERLAESITIRGPDFDDVRPHLANFFDAVRNKRPVTEDAVFGHNAALACHMANESYFRRSAISWDESAKTIRG